MCHPPRQRANFVENHAKVDETFMDMFLAARDPLSTGTGTDYPGCTERELESLSFVDKWSRRSFAFSWRPVSHARTTRELVQWLQQNPSRETQAAIDRLQILRDKNKFWPDLAIKACHDLDRVFFAGKLAGKLLVRYEGDRRHLRGRGLRHAWGVTRSLTEFRPALRPMAKITLNSRRIFLKPTKYSKRRWTIGTLLHEMIHGKLGFLLPSGGSFSTKSRLRSVMYAV